MASESFIFALLLFKDAQFFQTLACKSSLLEFAFSLAILPVLVQNLQEILRNVLGRIKFLAFQRVLVEGLLIIRRYQLGGLIAGTLLPIGVSRE